MLDVTKTVSSTDTDEIAEQFPWPIPSGAQHVPEWTGRGFRVDGRDVPVLVYSNADSGWSQELTEMHEAELGSSHPIEVASRQRALDAIGRYADALHVVLEVGCASGYFLGELAQALPSSLVMGADNVPALLQRLAQRHPEIPLLQFDIVRVPLPDASVDAVVALNVLEHIQDDAGAITQIRRILRPGGVFYLEVPAGPLLYGVHDRVLMHHRRYSLRGAVALLKHAGFRIKRATHLGCFVYPAFALTKLAAKRYRHANSEQQEAIFRSSLRATRSSGGLDLTLRAERWLDRFVPLPFGIRCVVTAIAA